MSAGGRSRREAPAGTVRPTGEGEPAGLAARSRSPLFRLLDPALGLWCWAVIVALTAWSYGRGRLLERSRGPGAWGDVVRDWARGLLRLGGFELRREGRPPSAGPVVLLANHQSAFDIPVLAALVPPPVLFVAKAELLAVPMVGDALRRAGHVSVDRDEAEDRRRAVERSLERLAEGSKVVFFGEGTRSRGVAVRPLHAGAFRAAAEAGCPLVPVAIAGTHWAAAGRRGLLPRPTRVAVSFLPAVEAVEDLVAPEGRETVRRRLAREIERLEPGTGPRFGRPR